MAMLAMLDKLALDMPWRPDMPGNMADMLPAILTAVGWGLPREDMIVMSH